METKQERRERRERNRRKMRVTGKSVRLLHTLVQQRAEQAKRRLAAPTNHAST